MVNICGIFDDALQISFGESRTFDSENHHLSFMVGSCCIVKYQTQPQKNSVISRQKSSDAFLGEAIIPLEFYNVILADNNYYGHIKLRLTFISKKRITFAMKNKRISLNSTSLKVEISYPPGPLTRRLWDRLNRFKNHLLQILCLISMEKPVSLHPEHIRDEKVKVLESVQPIRAEDVVLGQYEGYTEDPTVPKDSKTPTFATVVLRIDNERWDGVPFILKAEKALNSRKADIRVQFKDVPGDIFKCNKHGRNEFVIRLQPSEAMYMKLMVKQPGLEMSTTQSELDLSYQQRYQDIVIPEAYERLILDTIRGDQQHFVRRDELKVAREIFTPLLNSIDNGEIKPYTYTPGSRGPNEADDLAASSDGIRSMMAAVSKW